MGKHQRAANQALQQPSLAREVWTRLQRSENWLLFPLQALEEDNQISKTTSIWFPNLPEVCLPGMEVEIEGAARPGMVTKDGLMICGTDGLYQEQFERNYLSLASWVVNMIVSIKNFKCNDLTGISPGKWLNVKLLSVAGKFVKACIFTTHNELWKIYLYANPNL